MIALTAAAMTTSRIRLGTMVIPVPLRRPWKLASESLALDHLSNGRLTLGLGAGAVWMGWQAFPDEPADTKVRTKILDETIDILDLLYQHKPFDYDGKHYPPQVVPTGRDALSPEALAAAARPAVGAGYLASHEVNASHP
jgi:alkanesulfonate monooxygenase SsuD/methylene tetrahydromethanopterin reductase-like flavin-dependent oxidoreductase (luciferase family)